MRSTAHLMITAGMTPTTNAVPILMVLAIVSQMTKGFLTPSTVATEEPSLYDASHTAWDSIQPSFTQAATPLESRDHNDDVIVQQQTTEVLPSSTSTLQESSLVSQTPSIASGESSVGSQLPLLATTGGHLQSTGGRGTSSPGDHSLQVSNTILQTPAGTPATLAVSVTGFSEGVDQVSPTEALTSGESFWTIPVQNHQQETETKGGIWGGHSLSEFAASTSAHDNHDDQTASVISESSVKLDVLRESESFRDFDLYVDSEFTSIPADGVSLAFSAEASSLYHSVEDTHQSRQTSDLHGYLLSSSELIMTESQLITSSSETQIAYSQTAPLYGVRTESLDQTITEISKSEYSFFSSLDEGIKIGSPSGLNVMNTAESDNIMIGSSLLFGPSEILSSASNSFNEHSDFHVLETDTLHSTSDTGLPSIHETDSRNMLSAESFNDITETLPVVASENDVSSVADSLNQPSTSTAPYTDLTSSALPDVLSTHMGDTVSTQSTDNVTTHVEKVSIWTSEREPVHSDAKSLGAESDSPAQFASETLDKETSSTWTSGEAASTRPAEFFFSDFRQSVVVVNNTLVLTTHTLDLAPSSDAHLVPATPFKARLSESAGVPSDSLYESSTSSDSSPGVSSYDFPFNSAVLDLTAIGSGVQDLSPSASVKSSLHFSTSELVVSSAEIQQIASSVSSSASMHDESTVEVSGLDTSDRLTHLSATMTEAEASTDAFRSSQSSPLETPSAAVTSSGLDHSLTLMKDILVDSPFPSETSSTLSFSTRPFQFAPITPSATDSEGATEGAVFTHSVFIDHELAMSKSPVFVESSSSERPTITTSTHLDVSSTVESNMQSGLSVDSASTAASGLPRDPLMSELPDSDTFSGYTRSLSAADIDSVPFKASLGETLHEMRTPAPSEPVASDAHLLTSDLGLPVPSVQSSSAHLELTSSPTLAFGDTESSHEATDHDQGYVESVSFLSSTSLPFTSLTISATSSSDRVSESVSKSDFSVPASDTALPLHTGDSVVETLPAFETLYQESSVAALTSPIMSSHSAQSTTVTATGVYGDSLFSETVSLPFSSQRSHLSTDQTDETDVFHDKIIASFSQSATPVMSESVTSDEMEYRMKTSDSETGFLAALSDSASDEIHTSTGTESHGDQPSADLASDASDATIAATQADVSSGAESSDKGIDNVSMMDTNTTDLSQSTVSSSVKVEYPSMVSLSGEKSFIISSSVSHEASTAFIVDDNVVTGSESIGDYTKLDTASTDAMSKRNIEKTLQTSFDDHLEASRSQPQPLSSSDISTETIAAVSTLTGLEMTETEITQSDFGHESSKRGSGGSIYVESYQKLETAQSTLISSGMTQTPGFLSVTSHDISLSPFDSSSASLYLPQTSVSPSSSLEIMSTAAADDSFNTESLSTQPSENLKPVWSIYSRGLSSLHSGSEPAFQSGSFLLSLLSSSRSNPLDDISSASEDDSPHVQTPGHGTISADRTDGMTSWTSGYGDRSAQPGSQHSPTASVGGADAIEAYLLTWSFHPLDQDLDSPAFQAQLKQGLEKSFTLGRSRLHVRVRRNADSSSSSDVLVEFQSTTRHQDGGVSQTFTVKESGRLLPAEDAMPVFSMVTDTELAANTRVKVIASVRPLVVLSSRGLPSATMTEAERDGSSISGLQMEMTSGPKLTQLSNAAAASQTAWTPDQDGFMESSADSVTARSAVTEHVLPPSVMSLKAEVVTIKSPSSGAHRSSNLAIEISSDSGHLNHLSSLEKEPLQTESESSGYLLSTQPPRPQMSHLETDHSENLIMSATSDSHESRSNQMHESESTHFVAENPSLSSSLESPSALPLLQETDDRGVMSTPSHAEISLPIFTDASLDASQEMLQSISTMSLEESSSRATFRPPVPSSDVQPDHAPPTASRPESSSDQHTRFHNTQDYETSGGLYGSASEAFTENYDTYYEPVASENNTSDFSTPVKTPTDEISTSSFELPIRPSLSDLDAVVVTSSLSPSLEDVLSATASASYYISSDVTSWQQRNTESAFASQDSKQSLEVLSTFEPSDTFFPEGALKSVHPSNPSAQTDTAIVVQTGATPSPEEITPSSTTSEILLTASDRSSALLSSEGVTPVLAPLVMSSSDEVSGTETLSSSDASNFHVTEIFSTNVMTKSIVLEPIHTTPFHDSFVPSENSNVSQYISTSSLSPSTTLVPTELVETSEIRSSSSVLDILGAFDSASQTSSNSFKQYVSTTSPSPSATFAPDELVETFEIRLSSTGLDGFGAFDSASQTSSINDVPLLSSIESSEVLQASYPISSAASTSSSQPSWSSSLPPMQQMLSSLVMLTRGNSVVDSESDGVTQSVSLTIPLSERTDSRRTQSETFTQPSFTRATSVAASSTAGISESYLMLSSQFGTTSLPELSLLMQSHDSDTSDIQTKVTMSTNTVSESMSTSSSGDNMYLPRPTSSSFALFSMDDHSEMFPESRSKPLPYDTTDIGSTAQSSSMANAPLLLSPSSDKVLDSIEVIGSSVSQSAAVLSVQVTSFYEASIEASFFAANTPTLYPSATVAFFSSATSEYESGRASSNSPINFPGSFEMTSASVTVASVIQSRAASIAPLVTDSTAGPEDVTSPGATPDVDVRTKVVQTSATSALDPFPATSVIEPAATPGFSEVTEIVDIAVTDSEATTRMRTRLPLEGDTSTTLTVFPEGHVTSSASSLTSSDTTNFHFTELSLSDQSEVNLNPTAPIQAASSILTASVLMDESQVNKPVQSASSTTPSVFDQRNPSASSKVESIFFTSSVDSLIQSVAIQTLTTMSSFIIETSGILVSSANNDIRISPPTDPQATDIASEKSTPHTIAEASFSSHTGLEQDSSPTTSVKSSTLTMLESSQDISSVSINSTRSPAIFENSQGEASLRTSMQTSTQPSVLSLNVQSTSDIEATPAIAFPSEKSSLEASSGTLTLSQSAASFTEIVQQKLVSSLHPESSMMTASLDSLTRAVTPVPQETVRISLQPSSRVSVEILPSSATTPSRLTSMSLSQVPTTPVPSDVKLGSPDFRSSSWTSPDTPHLSGPESPVFPTATMIPTDRMHDATTSFHSESLGSIESSDAFSAVVSVSMGTQQSEMPNSNLDSRLPPTEYLTMTSKMPSFESVQISPSSTFADILATGHTAESSNLEHIGSQSSTVIPDFLTRIYLASSSSAGESVSLQSVLYPPFDTENMTTLNTFWSVVPTSVEPSAQVTAAIQNPWTESGHFLDVSSVFPDASTSQTMPSITNPDTLPSSQTSTSTVNGPEPSSEILPVDISGLLFTTTVSSIFLGQTSSLELETTLLTTPESATPVSSGHSRSASLSTSPTVLAETPSSSLTSTIDYLDAVPTWSSTATSQIPDKAIGYTFSTSAVIGSEQISATDVMSSLYPGPVTASGYTETALSVSLFESSTQLMAASILLTPPLFSEAFGSSSGESMRSATLSGQESSLVVPTSTASINLMSSEKTERTILNLTISTPESSVEPQTPSLPMISTDLTPISREPIGTAAESTVAESHLLSLIETSSLSLYPEVTSLWEELRPTWTSAAPKFTNTPLDSLFPNTLVYTASEGMDSRWTTPESSVTVLPTETSQNPPQVSSSYGHAFASLSTSGSTEVVTVGPESVLPSSLDSSRLIRPFTSLPTDSISVHPTASDSIGSPISGSVRPTASPSSLSSIPTEMSPSASDNISSPISVSVQPTASSGFLTSFPTDVRPSASDSFGLSISVSVQPTVPSSFLPSFPINVRPSTSDSIGSPISVSVQPTAPSSFLPSFPTDVRPSASDSIGLSISNSLRSSPSEPILSTFSDIVRPRASSSFLFITPVLTNSVHSTESDSYGFTVADSIHPTSVDTVRPTLSNAVQSTVSTSSELTAPIIVHLTTSGILHFVTSDSFRPTIPETVPSTVTSILRPVIPSIIHTSVLDNVHSSSSVEPSSLDSAFPAFSDGLHPTSVESEPQSTPFYNDFGVSSTTGNATFSPGDVGQFSSKRDRPSSAATILPFTSRESISAVTSSGVFPSKSEFRPVIVNTVLLTSQTSIPTAILDSTSSFSFVKSDFTTSARTSVIESIYPTLSKSSLPGDSTRVPLITSSSTSPVIPDNTRSYIQISPSSTASTSVVPTSTASFPPITKDSIRPTSVDTFHPTSEVNVLPIASDTISPTAPNSARPTTQESIRPFTPLTSSSSVPASIGPSTPKSSWTMTSDLTVTHDSSSTTLPTMPSTSESPFPTTQESVRPSTPHTRSSTVPASIDTSTPQSSWTITLDSTTTRYSSSTTLPTIPSTSESPFPTTQESVRPSTPLTSSSTVPGSIDTSTPKSSWTISSDSIETSDGSSATLPTIPSSTSETPYPTTQESFRPSTPHTRSSTVPASIDTSTPQSKWTITLDSTTTSDGSSATLPIVPSTSESPYPTTQESIRPSTPHTRSSTVPANIDTSTPQSKWTITLDSTTTRDGSSATLPTIPSISESLYPTTQESVRPSTPLTNSFSVPASIDTSTPKSSWTISSDSIETSDGSSATLPTMPSTSESPYPTTQESFRPSSPLTSSSSVPATIGSSTPKSSWTISDSTETRDGSSATLPTIPSTSESPYPTTQESVRPSTPLTSSSSVPTTIGSSTPKSSWTISSDSTETSDGSSTTLPTMPSTVVPSATTTSVSSSVPPLPPVSTSPIPTPSPPGVDSLLQVKLGVPVYVDVTDKQFIGTVEEGLKEVYLNALNSRRKRWVHRRRKRQEDIKVKVTGVRRAAGRREEVEAEFYVEERGLPVPSSSALLQFLRLSQNQMSAILGYPVLSSVEAVGQVTVGQDAPQSPGRDTLFVVAIVLPCVLLSLLLLLLAARLCYVRRRQTTNGARVAPARYHRGDALADFNLAVDVEKGEIVDRSPSGSPTPDHGTGKKLAPSSDGQASPISATLDSLQRLKAKRCLEDSLSQAEELEYPGPFGTEAEGVGIDLDHHDITVSVESVATYDPSQDHPGQGREGRQAEEEVNEPALVSSQTGGLDTAPAEPATPGGGASKKKPARSKLQHVGSAASDMAHRRKPPRTSSRKDSKTSLASEEKTPSAAAAIPRVERRKSSKSSIGSADFSQGSTDRRRSGSFCSWEDPDADDVSRASTLSSSATMTSVTSISSENHTDASDEFTVIFPKSRSARVTVDRETGKIVVDALRPKKPTRKKRNSGGEQSRPALPAPPPPQEEQPEEEGQAREGYISSCHSLTDVEVSEASMPVSCLQVDDSTASTASRGRPERRKYVKRSQPSQKRVLKKEKKSLTELASTRSPQIQEVTVSLAPSPDLLKNTGDNMAMPGFALEPIAKMGRLGSPRPPTSPQQLPSRLDFLDQMKDDDSHSLLESELSFREESEANPLSSRLPFRNPFPGEDIEDSDSDEERGEPSKADHPDSAADRTVSEPAVSVLQSVRLGRHMRAHPGRERLEKAPTVEEQEQGRKLRQQLQDQQKYHRQQADMRQFVQHSINRELMRRDLSLQERSRAQHQQMKQLLNDAFQFPAMVEQVLQGHSQAALPPPPTPPPPYPHLSTSPHLPPPEMALVLSESNLRGAETLEGEHDEDVRTVMENLVQSEIQRLKSV